VRLTGPGHPTRHLLPAPCRAGRHMPPGGSTSPWPGCQGGRFTIRDSLLSEYASVGFEYGYSVEATDDLVAWEAQFGDFWNGAEIIVDNFLVAAEDKWGQKLGPGPPPAARLRGAGAGALIGPDRAVPHPVRPGQPPGDRADELGPVLPPAAFPDQDRGSPATRRVHPQVAAPVAPGPLAHRGVHLGFVRRGARRPGLRPRKASTPTP
jgi:hypothetical protein